ncbi:hypothetical protein C7M84_023498 [Penaeus vannamei]|uniref:Uncharacterized protein n=1 Tax=Penaeus vannamei TaxID=6689 RepID=A0A3R7MI99_PENVA|nr:hypothetical protein C7M84_023498 [Penaeus vannamei]
MGTGVSQFGVAFLLKHVPNLRSLGDCNSVPEALEILVGNKSLQRSSFMARLRKYARRFKLTRVKEDCVSASKVLVVATLCPEIKDLSLWHRFREVDLDRLNDLHLTPSHFTSHLMQLQNLKHLTMVNVSSRSVAGAIQALGSQLTALTVQCRGLDVPGIFENCTNLKYLTMEGEDCSAPYEAVDSFRHTALTSFRGWNITAEEFNAFLKETEMEDYDIQIIYNPRRKRSFLCSSYRSESFTDEDFMEDSYEDSELWGPMRYQFPLVIL